MENSRKAGTGKIRGIIDKTVEAGAWTGIVLYCTLMNVMPATIRERMGLLPNLFDDRRRDRRLHVDKTVSFIRNGYEMQTAHLINISRSGMYVEIDTPSDIGQEMFINLTGRNLGVFTRVNGRVMRRSERGMAIRFT
ncbi:MAG: PilZ domain-containing protein [Desulfomonilia bacterium]